MVFKIGDDYIYTTASKRKVIAVIKAIKESYGDSYNQFDIILQLTNQGYDAYFTTIEDLQI